MGLQGEHFTDPCMGVCGMARFIQVEGCPCAPSLSAPPWKKLICVLSKAKTKASVQSFCVISKVGPLEPAGPLEVAPK